MKRIITLAALGLSLAGGVASADSFHDQRPREQVRVVDRDHDARVYRDVHRRPPVIVERIGGYRRGFAWVSGEWQWSGYRWQWVPGHYVRGAFRR